MGFIMAVPKSYTKTFKVGGFDFYHHHAEDAHGTVSDTYMVDSLSVSRSEFYRIIRESTEDCIGYITEANNRHKITRGMT